MKVETILFGEIDIPEEKSEIISELDKAKKRIMFRCSRYEQSRIDRLEEASDRFRRLEEDV